MSLPHVRQPPTTSHDGIEGARKRMLPWPKLPFQCAGVFARGREGDIARIVLGHVGSRGI